MDLLVGRSEEVLGRRPEGVRIDEARRGRHGAVLRCGRRACGAEQVAPRVKTTHTLRIYTVLVSKLDSEVVFSGKEEGSGGWNTTRPPACCVASIRRAAGHKMDTMASIDCSAKLS